jgi:HK97 family phage major capsid protein
MNRNAGDITRGPRLVSPPVVAYRGDLVARATDLKKRLANIPTSLGETRRKEVESIVEAAISARLPPAARTTGQFLLRVGKWMRAEIGNDDARQWCRDNGIGVTRAAAENPNTAGGAVVPTEVADVIISLLEIAGTFRANASTYKMGRDTKSVPRRISGFIANFAGENTLAAEAAAAAFDNASFTAKN